MGLVRQQLWSGGQTHGWWSTAGVSSHLPWPSHWLTQSSAPRTSSPSSTLFAPMLGPSGLSSLPTSSARTPDPPGLEEDLWVDRSGQAPHTSICWSPCEKMDIHMQILSSCYTGRDIHAHTTKHRDIRGHRTHIQILDPMCVATSCIHTRPEREPHVYQEVQSCSNI